MKALLLTEYCQLELVDLPTPDIGDRRAGPRRRVRHLRQRRPRLRRLDRPANSAARHGTRGCGNHRSGGPRRHAVHRPGDRVTFDSTVYCGECDFCRAGRMNLCDRRQVLGVSCGDYRRHGAFAEFVAVPARILFALPDEAAARARGADRGRVGRRACGENHAAVRGRRTTTWWSSAPG